MRQAFLRTSRGESQVTLLNASSRGVQLLMQSPPQRGETVELIIGSASLVGRVRWARGARMGISLRDRISVMNIVEGGCASPLLAADGRAAGPGGSYGRQGGGDGAGAVAGAVRVVQILLVVGFALAGAWTVMEVADGVFGALAPAEAALKGGGEASPGGEN